MSAEQAPNEPRDCMDVCSGYEKAAIARAAAPAGEQAGE